MAAIFHDLDETNMPSSIGIDYNQEVTPAYTLEGSRDRCREHQVPIHPVAHSSGNSGSKHEPYVTPHVEPNQVDLISNDTDTTHSTLLQNASSVKPGQDADPRASQI